MKSTMKGRMVLIYFLALFVSGSVFAQQLPQQVKRYLGQNYKGWRLSESKKACGPETNAGYVFGDFDGNGSRDYAVKFTKGKKGYIVAFLKKNDSFKTYILHNYDANEAEYSSLGTYRKGDTFEYGIRSSS